MTVLNIQNANFDDLSAKAAKTTTAAQASNTSTTAASAHAMTLKMAKMDQLGDRTDFSTSMSQHASTSSSSATSKTLTSQPVTSAQGFVSKQYNQMHDAITSKYQGQKAMILKQYRMDNMNGTQMTQQDLQNELDDMTHRENYEYHVLDQLKPTLETYGNQFQQQVDQISTKDDNPDNPNNIHLGAYSEQVNKAYNNNAAQLQKAVKSAKIGIYAADFAKADVGKLGSQVAGDVGIPKDGGFWSTNWCAQFASMPYRKLYGEDAPCPNGSWDQGMIYGDGNNAVSDTTPPHVGDVVQFHGYKGPDARGVILGKGAAHVGIITDILPNGDIVTAEGNINDNINGHYGNGVKSYTYTPTQYASFGFQNLSSAVLKQNPNADELPVTLPPGPWNDTSSNV